MIAPQICKREKRGCERLQAIDRMPRQPVAFAQVSRLAECTVGDRG
jgi:hypothetical protein